MFTPVQETKVLPCPYCGRAAERINSEIADQVQDCVRCHSCARDWVKINGRWFEAALSAPRVPW